MLNIYSMDKKYFIYILSNRYRGTIYIGMTSNLNERIRAHKEKLIKGFTYKYNLNKLIYFEEYKTAEEAITREKHLKHWKRAWKIELI
jgi:putative endonuclease